MKTTVDETKKSGANVKSSNGVTLGPGLLAIAATVAAVLAVPLGMASVWFPREMDRLSAEISNASMQSSFARSAAEKAEDASVAVGEQISSLVAAMAMSDAARNGPVSWFAVKEMLPINLVSAIENAEINAAFRHSHFNGTEWVFVDRASFNKLSSVAQESIIVSIEQNFGRFSITDYDDLRWYEDLYGKGEMQELFDLDGPDIDDNPMWIKPQNPFRD